MDSKSDREIAIYWDYENVPLPGWCSPAEAAKRIHGAVSGYGRVVERRLYFGFHGGAPADCSGLDLSGFDLVNAPSRDSKGTPDKKLIADVLTFAWDSAARKAATKPCVVVITGDGDYAYTLSKLRDRGVMSVVMFGEERSVAQILVENADVALGFYKDVLGAGRGATRGASGNPPPVDQACRNIFFGNIPELENVEVFVRFIEHNYGVNVQCATMAVPRKGYHKGNASYLVAVVQFANARDGAKVLSAANSFGLTFRGRSIVLSIPTKLPTPDDIAATESAFRYGEWSRPLLTKGRAVSQHPVTPQPSARGECRHPPVASAPQAADAENKPRLYGRARASSANAISQSAPGQCRLGQHHHPAQRPAALSSRMPAASESRMRNAFVAHFCVVLYNEQLSLATTGVQGGHEKQWVSASKFGPSLTAATAEFWLVDEAHAKSIGRDAKDAAIFEGYAAAARRKKDGDDTFVGVPWHRNRGVRWDLCAEPYFRLTEKGRIRAEKIFRQGSVDQLIGPRFPDHPLLDPLPRRPGEKLLNNSPESLGPGFGSFLHIVNLPHATKVEEFVEFIEVFHQARVKRAVIKRWFDTHSVSLGDREPSRCNCNIELLDPNDGLKMVVLSLTNGIIFKNHDLKVKAEGDLASLLEKMDQGGESSCYTRSEIMPAHVNDSPHLQIAPDSPNTSNAQVDNLARVLCTCVFRAQKLLGNLQLFRFDETWVDYSSVASVFHSAPICRDIPKGKRRVLFRVLRDIAASRGYIQCARRQLGGERRLVGISPFGDGGAHETLSTDIYVRLTDSFLTECSKSAQRVPTTKETCVFFKNLPWPTKASQFANFLEGELGAIVRRVIIHHRDLDVCSAHAEFVAAEDGVRLCRDDAAIIFMGRQIDARFDLRIPREGTEIELSPSLVYMKREGARPTATDQESVSVGANMFATLMDDDKASSMSETGSVADVEDPSLYEDLSPDGAENRVQNADGAENQVQNADAAATDDENAHCEESKSGDQHNEHDYPGSSTDVLSSKIILLKKELDESVLAKDFAKAITIQAYIARLEKYVEINAAITREMENELDKAVRTGQFTQTFLIRNRIETRIEGFENGILSEGEATSLIKGELREKLKKAIESKDFAEAATIQTDINRLEN